MKRLIALMLAVMLLTTCALAEVTESKADNPIGVTRTSEVAETTETDEPAETAETTETDEPAETVEATDDSNPAEAAEAAEAPSADDNYADKTTAEGEHSIQRDLVMTYVFNMASWIKLPICLVDGIDDLPWLDLEDFCTFMNVFQQQFFEDTDYKLEYSAEGEQVWLTRESGYTMTVDFEKNTIFFDDYDAFLHDSTDKPLVDLVSATGYDAEGRGELFQRLNTGSHDRYGESILLELDNYGIQLIHQGDYYLVPAQTLSDFVLATSTGLNLFYNGKEAFCANGDLFGSVGSDTSPLTELGERYYSGKEDMRTLDLAVYGYNELCLMLDKLYGLKELHNVTSFDKLFSQLGYKDALLSPDPTVADNKLYDFLDLQLDDIHSHFSGYSFLAGKRETEGRFGIMGRKLDMNFDYYDSMRSQYYPNGFEGYEEVGNTAYITFDEFVQSAPSAYYAAIDNIDNMPNNVVGLIILAHRMIYREDSPIENVVIDLSNNGGGSLNAAAFLLSWVFGEGQVSLKNTFTGASSTAIYRVDTNLDREFDERDQVSDKHIYCLISPCSFSCGNMVPAAFKASGQVTLLGRTSGGGSCLVMNMSTAWGTFFEISGAIRMSFRKNGVFYDIDRGVEPDFVINDVRNFYDRKALTDYINSLF